MVRLPQVRRSTAPGGRQQFVRLVCPSEIDGSTLHTDEAGVYRWLGGLFFTHQTVNHGIGEFVRDDVTANGIESVFAVLKRGITGVFHHVTPKHLGRYVNEFSFRLNEGNVKHHTLTRLDSFVINTAGRRLTYKALIA